MRSLAGSALVLPLLVSLFSAADLTGHASAAEPDEIAACAPYLRRQLEVLDPALVVTLGRHSMGRFMPGAKISAAHGTTRPIDPSSGAGHATVYAMYHPAAALRAPQVERQSYADARGLPRALEDARRARRARPIPTEPVQSIAGRVV